MSTAATTLSRSDRIGLYLTVLLGAVGAAVTTVTAITRLAEVIPGHDIRVLVPFVNETAPLPIGSNGAPIDVSVDQAIVTVADPGAVTLFALIADPIVTALTIIAEIVLLCLLCVNIARGRAFHRRTVHIVSWSSGVLLVGWVLTSLFRTMGVNGALAAVSDHSYDGVLFQTDFTPVFGVLALGAVLLAFQIGHRLERETEGLV